MDALKTAKAMTPFTADNKTRVLLQQGLLAYVRELTTRVPELDCLTRYREHNFDITPASFYEPTPGDGDRNDHAPTRIRQDLATVLALTARGNAAIIVHDAEDTADGVAIFRKLVKAHGQFGRRRYGVPAAARRVLVQRGRRRHRVRQQVPRDMQQLPEHDRITDSRQHPADVSPQRDQHARRDRRRRRHNGIERARSARTTVPEPPITGTPRRQDAASASSYHMLETTCENILSSDPTAPTQATKSSALALATFGHDICTSCNGTGRATHHANHKRDDGRTRETD